jgi:hypothetical protein
MRCNYGKHGNTLEKMERPRSILSLIRVSGEPQVDRTGIPRRLLAISQYFRS